jgi:tetratricopeptide (TPR) repeat protein
MVAMEALCPAHHRRISGGGLGQSRRGSGGQMTSKRISVSLSDHALSRLLRVVVLTLVVGIPLFGVLYVLDQRVGSGPSLAQRQVQSAERQVRALPDNIGLRIQLAQAYRQANRLDDALKQYDEVLKVDGNNRGALMGRGEILRTKGDLKGAAGAYKKVAANATGEFAGVDPQLEEAHYYLAAIAVTEGSLKDAVTELEAALKIDSTDADAWYLLGTVRLKDGAPDQAVSAFRKALLFVPTGWCEPYAQLETAYRKLSNAAEAEYAGAMVAFCQQNPAEAARQLMALTSGPAAVDALLGLGMVAESTASRDDAVKWYQMVLTVDAKNSSAMSALARLGAGPSGSAKPPPTAAGSPTAGNR